MIIMYGQEHLHITWVSKCKNRIIETSLPISQNLWNFFLQKY